MNILKDNIKTLEYLSNTLDKFLNELMKIKKKLKIKFKIYSQK